MEPIEGKIKNRLTKSKFLEGMVCSRRLFYSETNQYLTKDKGGDFSEGLKIGGFQVGELARQYFEGIQIHHRTIEEGKLATSKLMEKENIVIFEGVVFNDRFMIRPDIIEKIGNTVNLIEVKSKSVESVEKTFYAKTGDKRIIRKWKNKILDISFQTFVFREQFPDIKVIPYLMLVDKSSKTSIKGLNQMFKVRDVGGGRLQSEFTGSKDKLGNQILCKMDVSKYVEFVLNDMKFEGKKFYELVDDLSSMMEDNEKPKITLGGKCKDCVFRITSDKNDGMNGYKECWSSELSWSEPEFNKPHIFDIWKLGTPSINKLISEKIYLIEDIDLETWGNGKIKNRQKRQMQAMLESDKEEVNPNLFEEMKSWTFPLHFIDFETATVAIPFNKDKRPYEQIVFQFSIHDILEDQTVIHSAEWLSTEPGTFPNINFIRELRNSLSNDNGTIFCYSPYENSVLNTIHGQIELDRNNIPDAQELLDWIRTVTYWNEGKKRKIGPRVMVDMLKLVIDYYYHPLMKGSNSIKEVLPTILTVSEFLKTKYQRPYENSRNYGIGQIWYKLHQETGIPIDPYQLQLGQDEIDESVVPIKQGGEAMVAYNRLQFLEMEITKRNELNKSLLKYCELDTLAMVMIYEHWNDLSKSV